MSSLSNSALGMVPSAPATMGTTLTFTCQILQSSLASSLLLLLLLLLILLFWDTANIGLDNSVGRAPAR